METYDHEVDMTNDADQILVDDDDAVIQKLVKLFKNPKPQAE